MTPAHVSLLGDSIFDNGAYTSGAPDVLAHLRALLPRGWSASSAAMDGTTTTGLASQLERVSPQSTHIVVAVGGNDALHNRDLLAARVTSSTQALNLFADRVERFEATYRAAIASVLDVKRTTILCTIYNGWLGPDEARIARVALMMFNDVILRAALERGLAVIDLRAVCAGRDDYANSIEPSGVGGRKIARAITLALGLAERSSRVSHIYAGV